MSFYRTFFIALASIAFASSVFAQDTPTIDPVTDTTQMNALVTKLNVNTATAKELMKVKGLNAAKARALVAYRKKHGDFKSLDDLMNVRGFKRMTSDHVKEVQDQLTVD